MQATEALCHLSVTDIKKHFATFDFFCKNEACVNCGSLNATTLIWLGAVYQSTFGTGALVSKIKKWCHLPVFLIRFQLGLHFRVDHSNLRCNIDYTAITCDLTELSCQTEKNRKNCRKKKLHI